MDSKWIVHHAFGIIRAAETFLRDHLRIASHIPVDSFKREDRPEIPFAALREALANAVVHREYHQHGGTVTVRVFDDRVEVDNVGGLHFGLSVDDLYAPHRAKPWNPVMASIIYRRGIVESIGTGTLRMITLCRQAGNAAPHYKATATDMQVTFTRPGSVPPFLASYQLTAEQLAVIEALAAGISTRPALTERLDRTERSTRRALEQLREHHLVASMGRGITARWELFGDAVRAYPEPSAFL